MLDFPLTLLTRIEVKANFLVLANIEKNPKAWFPKN